MAKSVLDLYELYNLVIQRGGLVDVINKKLWQEIIKGLHLPSSITSAAFTLRTQYMKYLYPYECEKRRLSTPGELQAAIDGNRREGRRGSYGGGGGSPPPPPPPPPPITLVRPHPLGHPHTALNGNHHHHNNNHLTPHLMPPNIVGAGGPAELEARMAEYVKMLNKELNPPIKRQMLEYLGSPPSSPPTDGGCGVSPVEMTKLSLWNNVYGAGVGGSPPPQKEALNLEKREDRPPPKRPHPDNDQLLSGAHIKISTRGDGRGGNSDNSLVVSIDINGTMYQGVLFAQTSRNPRLQT
ncbi:hypothetical protein AAG570_013028 [Ranatra chinensis]|uniref:Protein dead ringer n=1 Tax=Ranatra chinensis TaxID=642074 RepID=A0ABD0YG43_9HEMI